ncbi:MAG: hypothetical protein H7258_09655 [Ferruginibacter sp.]|nr:hypothetical protein [Ferruginibacter sp.]
MKKEVKPVKKIVPQKEERPSKLKEPVAPYKSVKFIPQLKDFTYTEFKKIADNTPFTQAEWAAILHLSERTLQRYAKSNSSFAAINAERAFQIEKVLKEGKLAFGTAQNFYNWLKRNPSMLEADLSLQSLTSLDGIEKVLTQLGRIQHGLFT